jgi:hypothetical protein
MNSFAAPIAVSGDPAIAPARGRKVRPLINSLLFIDDRFMQVSQIAISSIFQRITREGLRVNAESSKLKNGWYQHQPQEISYS